MHKREKVANPCAGCTGCYGQNKIPFTKEMKEDYTILMPQMAPIQI